jgi:hypothetical protein
MLVKILGKLILKLTSLSSGHRQALEDIERVRALPFEEVKQSALTLLADPLRFRCVTDSFSDNCTIERLGPILRDFFSHFESVKEIRGDFCVGRQIVGDSALRNGFLKIGYDFASSELVVRPGEDSVYIVTDSEHILDGDPTIYHNILLLE